MNQERVDKLEEMLDVMLKKRLKDFQIAEWSIKQVNERDILAPGTTKIPIYCVLKGGGTVEMNFEFPSLVIKDDLDKIFKKLEEIKV